MRIRVGDTFRICSPVLCAGGVITKINRSTIVFRAPCLVCRQYPDGWIRGIRLERRWLENEMVRITPAN